MDAWNPWLNEADAVGPQQYGGNKAMSGAKGIEVLRHEEPNFFTQIYSVKLDGEQWTTVMAALDALRADGDPEADKVINAILKELEGK